MNESFYWNLIFDLNGFIKSHTNVSKTNCQLYALVMVSDISIL